jgi:cell division protein FtsB
LKGVAPFPRRRQKSYGYARLLTLSGALLFCFLLAVAAVQVFQHRRLQRELAAAEQRVSEYESRNREMAEEIARLHEPDYIELLARKLLGLVKPGEIVYRLDD